MTTPFYVRWLQEAPAALDKVIDQVESERHRIRTDDKLSPQGRYEALLKLREWADRQVATIRDKASEAQTSAEEHVRLALRPSLTTSEQLLQEAQERRAWERARALLEAGATASELITRAGEAGDVATLRVLRTELPTWYEARSGAVAGDLRGSSARREARESALLLMEDIDRAEAPHLPKRQREALETRFQVQAQADVVRAKLILANDVATGNDTGASWLRAGFATAAAERGLMGPVATSKEG